MEESIIRRIAAPGGVIVAGLIHVTLGLAVVLAMIAFAMTPARSRHPFRWRRTARDTAVSSSPAPPLPTSAASDTAATGSQNALLVGPLGQAVSRDISLAIAKIRRDTRRKARLRRLRRAGVTLLLLSAVIFGGTGIYAWQVTSALRDAERAIYVPLPAAAGVLEVPATAEAPIASADPVSAATPTTMSSGGTLGAVVNAATADEDPALDPVWRGKRYINVLVLGFDSRADDTGPPRSDVFLIAQLDLHLKTVNIVSVPRDLWVEVPGYGSERINSAFPLGWRADQPASGVALTKKTIEHNFGLPIDYYIAVNFQGFQQVIDAVGGIEIDVPYYLRDDEYPTEDYGIERIEFFPGKQKMNGETTLKYVRTRHQDSDYGRRRRQLQVILALFEKGQSVNIVPRLPGVLRSFAGTVQTNFTFEEQLALGRVALALDRNNITSYSVDESMTSGWITPGGASVVRGDWQRIDVLLDIAFAERIKKP